MIINRLPFDISKQLETHQKCQKVTVACERCSGKSHKNVSQWFLKDTHLIIVFMLTRLETAAAKKCED
jgi:hypothetical protein